WPIIVTENGVADGRGEVRPGFIRDHIYALDRARADGANVIGYIYWSLMDNFEWSHGYRGRFGLFTLHFADPNLTRRPTPPAAAGAPAPRRGDVPGGGARDRDVPLDRSTARPGWSARPRPGSRSRDPWPGSRGRWPGTSPRRRGRRSRAPCRAGSAARSGR